MKLMKTCFFMIFMAVVMIACRQEDDGITPGSVLNTEPSTLNELDQWIFDNFTKPYNIEVVYRWTESLVDQSRFLYPPHTDSVQSALEIVKKLWIDPYNEVSGSPFIQVVAPRQLVLIGGRNANPSGTSTLGLAEAGKRVTLFEIDLLVKTSKDAVNRFINTIQHEYAHILNQTKPFNEEAYGEITPEGYTAQWFNESTIGSREDGFISAYARSNESEDFAEMVSGMLARNRTEWDALINDIGPFIPKIDDDGNIEIDGDGNVEMEPSPAALEARANIRRKERIVIDYYQREFDLDLYELQDSVFNATIRLVN